MSDTIEVLLNRYRQHQEIRNYSPRTREVQAGYLRLLERFLISQRIADAQAVTGSTLADFQRDLFYQPTARGTARSVAGQNQVLVAVKNFFRFLKDEGCLARDPSETLHYAREPQTLPRNVLTPQEARRIVEAPDTQTVLGYRDRTILEVLYATGIRRSELLNLEIENVNLDEELLRINGGKGGTDRLVPLSRIACQYLETYLKGIRPQLLRQRATNRLFLSLQARPLGRNAVSYLVEKYAKLARIKKHVTPHVWRHTCATHLIQNKANLRHVQEILGHKSLVTTERYLHLTVTDLKEAHRKFHPRERGASAQP